MIICKQFSFHAAHQLPFHNGACKRLHGHTYKLEVLVEGQPKVVGPPDRVGFSDEGMVLDFTEIKSIYKAEIEPLVEHQFLNETLEDIVPVTTCELMAQWMRDVLFAHLVVDREAGLKDVGVRLWETPTSWAEAWS